MRGTDIRSLCDDIRQHGQQSPIVIYGGKILDGRARYAACRQAGVEPNFVRLSGDEIGGDPIAYVRSCNFYRRHVTPAEADWWAAAPSIWSLEDAKDQARAAHGRLAAAMAVLGVREAGKVHLDAIRELVVGAGDFNPEMDLLLTEVFGF
jgi:hypothetical protein